MILNLRDRKRLLISLCRLQEIFLNSTTILYTGSHNWLDWSKSLTYERPRWHIDERAYPMAWRWV